MSVVGEVLAELWSMFAGDRRLTLLLLAVVAAAAVAARVLSAPAAVPAAILVVGALAVLCDSVLQAARKARR
ncbi:MAG TPA: hypothetical protein VMU93_02195 [Caulobacteraceae bacterium]|nr:hypothetical protein [Caulobacteraceae bacterium]